MNKSTKNLSEVHSFFVGKRQSQLLSTLSGLVESLKLDSRTLGGNKYHNSKLTNLQLFHILIMMPFFGVQGFSHYADSVLHKMFSGKKDILYSFMAQDAIDWRHILYRIAYMMISPDWYRSFGTMRDTLLVPLVTLVGTGTKCVI